jgi:hypothetical protein
MGKERHFFEVVTFTPPPRAQCKLALNYQFFRYIPLIFPFLLIIPDVVNFVASGFAIRTSSPAISKDQWDCWTKQGLTDPLIRVYHPKGYVDAAGMANLIAWQEMGKFVYFYKNIHTAHRCTVGEGQEHLRMGGWMILGRWVRGF